MSKEMIVERDTAQQILESRKEFLENQNEALRKQVEQLEKDLQTAREKQDLLSRYERGVDLIRTWCEEQGDHFISGLIDLIED